MEPEQQQATAETIARELGGAKKTGGGWTCKCPAHEDKHNSLSLTERDGKLLWKCHAGCDQKAVMNELIARKLIAGRVSQHTPTRVQGHTRKVETAKKNNVVSLGKIVATYDYMDVTGRLLFQVVRFDPKTFRQRRPNGAGWDWGLGRTKPVLYRLADVLEASTVFIVEGEKDADRLREEFNLCATTSPMGAGKWRDDMGEALAGKHVVILPDNDDAGRSHADDIAASADAHDAASVKIIALPRLPEKGDPSDWLDAGGTRVELQALYREAPNWRTGFAAGDPAWRTKLVQGDQGPQGNEYNAILAMEQAPELAGRVRFDAFRTALQCHDMPWSRSPDWRDWRDEDDVRMAAWLQGNEINIQPVRVASVAQAVGGDIEHHPVRAYLDGLRWDGTKRIAGWLYEFMGVKVQADAEERNALYVEAVAQKWLISAVARIMQPGCKVDVCMILEGGQGIGKSSALRILAGDEWFADQISHVGNKDAAIDIRGKWIIELGELAAMGKAESDVMKEFMSRQIDHYRPPFGRRSLDVARQCVFSGSTNQDSYLKDETGNRRYWPVRCGIVDLKGLAKARDQLWAEAVAAFKAGAIWWLTADEMMTAKLEQEERTDADPWQPLIERWLGANGKSYADIESVMRDCLEMKKETWDQRSKNRIAKCFRMMGWEYVRLTTGDRLRVYRRPS